MEELGVLKFRFSRSPKFFAPSPPTIPHPSSSSPFSTPPLNLTPHQHLAKKKMPQETCPNCDDKGVAIAGGCPRCGKEKA
ncbi:hypothetical protein FJTKL_04829 [Diaporthe vaccinii]|uniref:Uncharacterized protein n=1 Tax=Diaporthe vaccinii TaxID=105482 RepID=A0ABR4DS94_9PEZI